MQSSDIVLYNLSKQAAKEHYQYDRLYRNLYNEDFHSKAYDNICRNKGSAAKEIDDKAGSFGGEKIQSIIASLKDETYQPKTVRNHTIPKKNGRTRPVSIPAVSDQVVQEVCRMILEAIYAPAFSQQFHELGEKRSHHTAFIQVKQSFSGVNWFIKGEIGGFLDNIQYQVLINILRKRIKDEKFIRLLWKLLKAGYLEQWKLQRTYNETTQEGTLSPLLANIYYNEFDTFVEEKLKPSFYMQRLKKDKEKPEEKLRETLLKEYKENTSDPIRESCKRMKYVRFADEFLIGVHGSKEDCEQIKNDAESFLKEHLKLEMQEVKTHIRHSTHSTGFLGYDVFISHNHRAAKKQHSIEERKYHGTVQLEIPTGTIEKVIVTRKMVKDIDAKQWDMLHRPELTGLSDLKIIETYNAELRELYHYYCLAENVSPKMRQLRHVMEYSCLKTLANKYKSSVSQMKVKYKRGKDWGIQYETKHGARIAYFFNDGFKQRQPWK
ncbi:reverse transcriptase/maturase family protein [Metabacillus lacus]|nr:reverse transcriptase/maturase family protein [Metabacillus lacus]